MEKRLIASIPFLPIASVAEQVRSDTLTAQILPKVPKAHSPGRCQRRRGEDRIGARPSSSPAALRTPPRRLCPLPTAGAAVAGA